MKSDSIETITAEIKRLLYKENRISINDIMKTIHYGIIHFSLANLYITKIRKYVGSREKRPTFLY